MEKFFIRGGNPLKGTVYISGAKNAAVALVAATILCDEPCTLENVPAISDITKCLDILKSMGAVVKMEKEGVIYIDTSTINTTKVPYKLAETMRASSYFLGTLLGRFHEAFVPMPGGCYLGDRPIDQHGDVAHDVGVSAGCIDLILEVGQIGGSLEQQDDHRQVTGVLVELHASTLTLALHLLEAGDYHTHQLDNDRRGDVGHDTQCEDRGLAECTTREHVEQLHQTTVGEVAHGFEVGGVDAGQHHMASKAIDHNEQECGDEALAQVLNLPDVF